MTLVCDFFGKSAGIIKLVGAKNVSTSWYLRSFITALCQDKPFASITTNWAFLNSSNPAIPLSAYRKYLFFLSCFRSERVILKVNQPLPALSPPAVLMSIPIFIFLLSIVILWNFYGICEIFCYS